MRVVLDLPRIPLRRPTCLWGVGLLAVGCVAAAADETLATRIEKHAAAVAIAQVSVPDRYEPVSCRYGGASGDPAAAARLELSEAKGPNASGVVSLRFRLLVDGVPRGEARATCRGRVHGPALQVQRTLLRGVTIAPADVVVRDADLTRLAEAPLRGTDELVDRVPVRTLATKRILTPALLGPVPLVRRGETVELKIESGRLSVAASATAMSDGALGDVVRARNSASGVVVRARVAADGSLTPLP